MTDAPTPQGYVQDAEEALGKARAMRDQAHRDWREWEQRALRIRLYRDDVRAWYDAGSIGDVPSKPTFGDET